MSTTFLKLKGHNDYILEDTGPVDSREKALPLGYYSIKIEGGGLTKEIIKFIPVVQTETLVQFKEGVYVDIWNTIHTFFKKETIEKYKAFGIRHQSASVIWGKRGIGKTALCNILCNNAVEHLGAIAIDFSGVSVWGINNILKAIRKAQNTPIIVFIDECEETFKHGVSEWLKFLDGNNSMDDVYILGSTNFLDKIPKRISQRKSRIANTYQIKSLPSNIYKDFVVHKIADIAKEDLHKIVFNCVEKGLTIDETKSLLLEWQIYGSTLDEAIEEADKYEVYESSGDEDEEDEDYD